MPSRYGVSSLRCLRCHVPTTLLHYGASPLSPGVLLCCAAESPAGQEGLEPTTPGFGDRCSTIGATGLFAWPSAPRGKRSAVLIARDRLVPSGRTRGAGMACRVRLPGRIVPSGFHLFVLRVLPVPRAILLLHQLFLLRLLVAEGRVVDAVAFRALQLNEIGHCSSCAPSVRRRAGAPGGIDGLCRATRATGYFREACPRVWSTAGELSAAAACGGAREQD
jgi:hypothetical protein